MSTLVEIEVERDGQDVQRVEVKMRTVLLWEKRFKGRAMVLLGEASLKAEYLYELAWLMLGEPVPLDEFCATTDVTPVSDEEADDEADPTQTVQPTGP